MMGICFARSGSYDVVMLLPRRDWIGASSLVKV
jgi:hypothetical protein